MCGFAGIIGNDTIDYKNIDRMKECITHRGPDSEGVVGLRKNSLDFVELNTSISYDLLAIMSFRRLSIRDLSEKGNQPMLETNIGITFVGEIYNAEAMKEQLLKKGESFNSETDTEIILKWYKQYGLNSLINTIKGMYAIVIIDSLKKHAYLIRDRFGIKPLYYFYSSNVLVYSSEIKSLCVSGYYSAAICEDSLGEHILYRSPGVSSLFKGICHVLPGEMVTFNLGTGKIMRKKWFCLDDYTRLNEQEMSETEAICLLEDGMDRAIRNQLVSDVSIGIQLSGGIDSGIIASFARRYGDFKSYSINGGRNYYSEAEMIRRVNLRNTGLMSLNDFCEDDFLDNYEKVIWHLDGMNNHPNALGFFVLTKKARKDVGVLLSGEGADELLGGYRQFVIGMSVNKDYNLYAVNADIDTDKRLVGNLFKNINFDKCIEKRAGIFNGFAGGNLDKHIKYEISTYLPDLLVKQDRMAMSNSIENRVPYLDYDFFDKMITIPSKYLVSFSEETKKIEGKYILKKLASNIYDESYGFQKKKGFPMPIRDWMKHEKFHRYVMSYIIPGMEKRKIIDVTVFFEKYKQLDRMTESQVKTIWKAINFETWAQLFIDDRRTINIF